MRTWFGCWRVGAATVLALIAQALLSVAVRAAEPTELRIFAAASLKTAFDEISTNYQKASATTLKISYAASSALAKQIEQLAPADVFVSADGEWMDYLQGQSLIVAASRADVIANRLVLIAPATAAVTLTVEPGFKLAEALGADGRLAVADVNAVPAGKYAKAALTSLGIWTSVENRLAQSDNVRAALSFVARAEAPLGIVYASDAAAEPRVKIVGIFPEASHPLIRYPAAVVTPSPQQARAADFISYLQSDPARQTFLANGFMALK